MDNITISLLGTQDDLERSAEVAAVLRDVLMARANEARWRSLGKAAVADEYAAYAATSLRRLQALLA